MKKVYVAVFSVQDREFDECGRGYLPLFNPVFGVYERLTDAINAVCELIYSDKEKYDVLDDTSCVDENGNLIGWEYTFSYTDKDTGAHGFYELRISTEYITPKKE